MVAPATAHAEFSISLPPEWHSVEELRAVPSGLSKDAHEALLALATPLLNDSDLALAASLMQPRFKVSGELQDVLVASLVVVLATGFSEVQQKQMKQPLVERGVRLVGNDTADFLTVSHVIPSSPGSMMQAVLTFSTPNIPLANEMLTIFADIASTARLTTTEEHT